MGEVEPFGVPAGEIAGLDLGHDGEDFGDVGSVVGDGAEGSHGFIVEVEILVELEHVGWMIQQSIDTDLGSPKCTVGRG